MIARCKQRTKHNNNIPPILKIPNDCLISILGFIVETIDINALLNDFPKCYDEILETKVYTHFIEFLTQKINKVNLTTIFVLKLVCKKWNNLSDYINKRFNLIGKYKISKQNYKYQNLNEIITSRLNINCDNQYYYRTLESITSYNYDINIGEQKFNISMCYNISYKYGESNNYMKLIGANLRENNTNIKKNDEICISIFEEYKNIKGDDVINVNVYNQYKNNNDNNKIVMLNKFKQQELKSHTTDNLNNKQNYKITKNNKYHIQQPRQNNKY